MKYTASTQGAKLIKGILREVVGELGPVVINKKGVVKLNENWTKKGKFNEG